MGTMILWAQYDFMGLRAQLIMKSFFSCILCQNKSMTINTLILAVYGIGWCTSPNLRTCLFCIWILDYINLSIFSPNYKVKTI